MIEELHAQISYLEKHSELPLHEERGRLQIIEHNLMYLSEEEYKRVQNIREHLKNRLKGFPGIGS